MKKPEVLIAVIFCLIGIAQYGRLISAQKKDYHWTPAINQESLSYGDKYFQIYLMGDNFKQLINEGKVVLRGRDQRKEYFIPLNVNDVSVRVNHIHEVAKFYLLSSAAFLASGITLLISSLARQVLSKNK